MERGLSEDDSPDADKDRGEDMAQASTAGLSENQRHLEMLTFLLFVSFIGFRE
jgi:hypothetical protein